MLKDDPYCTDSDGIVAMDIVIHASLTCPLQSSAANMALAPRHANLTTIARQMKEGNSFYKTWFSDISTYPIIGILVVANIGWTGFLTYKFMYCPSVRVSSKTKGKVIRTW